MRVYVDDPEVFCSADWSIFPSVEFDQDCEVLAVGLQRKVDDYFLSRFPNLKYIICPATGVDHIQTTRPVEIINLIPAEVPHIKASSEFTFLLMLALLRRFPEVSSGDFVVGEDLAGKTLGLLGHGRIGSNLHRYAEAFGVNVLWHDRTGGVSKSEVLQNSDVVVVVVNGIPENRNFIDFPEFREMCRQPYFVNISRALVVNEYALLRALETGQIRGAALDVIEDGSILSEYKDKNLIITPHVAGSTAQSRAMAVEYVLRKLKERRDGSPD